MSNTHDLTPWLNLWQSDAGREIMGGRLYSSVLAVGWFLYAPEPCGPRYPLSAIPAHIRDALAFRCLRYFDERCPLFEGDRGESIFHPDPAVIFNQAMLVVVDD